MNISNIANVVDLEHDEGRLIEIGFTTIDIASRKILKSYSIVLLPDFQVSKEISELTGWTQRKLERQGVSKDEVRRLLIKYGFYNRLLVADTSDEIDLIESNLEVKLSPHRINITLLMGLKFGFVDYNLTNMLEKFGLTFEGRLHLGKDDSFNIARIFLSLLD